MEYFEGNPGRDIPQAEVVDWATETWKERTDRVFRAPRPRAGSKTPRTRLFW